MSRRAQNLYSNEGKRRFDELNAEIDYLKEELHMTDFLMKTELESHVFNELDRAFLAAEMYKTRLIALYNSSRSQLQLVQMAASAKNYYCNYYSYNGWDAKRMKYNSIDFTEDIDFRPSNNYINQRQTNNKRCRTKRKSKRQIVPVDPKAIAVKTENASVIKNIMPLVTTGPIKDFGVQNMAFNKPNQFKTFAPPNKNNIPPPAKMGNVNQRSLKRTRADTVHAIPAKRTATGPAIIMPSQTSVKDTVMVRNYLSNTPPKLQQPKGKSKLSERLIIKTENSEVKSEPNYDMMEDDLEHHI